MRAPVSMIVLAAVCALTAGVAGCGSSPAEYRIMVTEPSGNMTEDGQLLLHWSCDPSVNPDTRYQGFQDALWTNVDGQRGSGVVSATATCPPGALLTAQVDAGVAEPGGRPTVLRCEVFDGDGERVATEQRTRGVDGADPVCRVPVP